MKNSALILADGRIFSGTSVGVPGETFGELIFNTAQTGYQEILTDPSYAYQLIVFTQPHIGNVGINAEDMESERVHANGVLLRHFSATPSNWRAQGNLKEFFLQHKIIALSDIDTRALTLHLQKHGSQLACIQAGKIDISAALACISQAKKMEGFDLTQNVGTQKIYRLKPKGEILFRFVIMDFGVKRSILNYLLSHQCELVVVPGKTSVEEILSFAPDGIVLSNGPGDPAACLDVLANIKILIDKNLPLMGICLGHQLLALANGAQTKKMRFGHHGANHPIKCLTTGKVAISSQNHGFVVADENLPTHFEVTHRSLFDGSIAGLKHKKLPLFSFQGHPEAGPGPFDLTHLFSQFISMVSLVGKLHA